MEKKKEQLIEDSKALRLFLEEIERKIAHQFLLLNSAQDRFEELVKELEELEEDESQDSDDTDFQNCYDSAKAVLDDYSLDKDWKADVDHYNKKIKGQKSWDRITRPTILRSRKIPEKSGNKKQ